MCDNIYIYSERKCKSQGRIVGKSSQNRYVGKSQRDSINNLIIRVADNVVGNRFFLRVSEELKTVSMSFNTGRTSIGLMMTDDVRKQDHISSLRRKILFRGVLLFLFLGIIGLFIGVAVANSANANKVNNSADGNSSAPTISPTFDGQTFAPTSPPPALASTQPPTFAPTKKPTFCFLGFCS